MSSSVTHRSPNEVAVDSGSDDQSDDANASIGPDPRHPETNEGQPTLNRQVSTSTASHHSREQTARDAADASVTAAPISDIDSPAPSPDVQDEKKIRPASSSSRPMSSPANLPAYPTVALEHRHGHRHHYRSAYQTKYLNNLMPIVGFLELTNSLDFPANVWNMTPVPTFAVGLMATGGSVSILTSFIVFYDFHLSVTNVRLLRKERAYLLEEKIKYAEAGDWNRVSMIQAWLDLNFREALWEVAERMLLDSLNGFAGILVGIGTILAIFGAHPTIYAASNQLSGYVGNSFNVVYGAANTAFAIYMFVRSRTYGRAVREAVQGGTLKQTMRRHTRRHQTYAIANGSTAFVGAIGSMVSAKHWQGYVVLIPCVIGAVFGNFFWRHMVGYDRDFCQRQPSAPDTDAEKKLLFSVEALELIEQHSGDKLLEKKTGPETLQFMAEHGMLEDFAARVLYDIGDKRSKLVAARYNKHFEVDIEQLCNIDEDILIKSASHVLAHVGYRRFRDQERTLAELWGCQLAQKLSRRASILGPQEPTKEEV